MKGEHRGDEEEEGSEVEVSEGARGGDKGVMLLRSPNTTSSPSRTFSTGRMSRKHSAASGSTRASAWLVGTGSMQPYNLMENLATAETKRVQNWQWIIT